MLTADIRYKGNWQQGTLKSQHFPLCLMTYVLNIRITATRRNKWISALKTAMQKAKVFGPAGDPGAIPAPDRLTLVPWEQIEAADKKKLQKEEQEKKRGGVREMSAPTADWNLTDKQAIMSAFDLVRVRRLADMCPQWMIRKMCLARRIP